MSGDPARGLQDRKPAAIQASLDRIATSSEGVSARARNIAVLLLVGTLWGVQPALIKASFGLGLSEMEAPALLLIIEAGLLGASLAARGRLFWPTAGKLKFMVVSGTADNVAPLLAAFAVAPHIDAGLLTLIMATTPIFTVALASAVGVHPLNRRNVLACATGLLAMALIVLPENALPSPTMLPWCLAAFSIPVFYSCGTIYVSRAWPEDMDVIQVAFGGTVLAGIALAPFWLSPVASGSLAGKSAGIYLGFAAISLIVVLELVLYFYLLKHAGPVFTSFSSFVMILSGFVAGAVIFDEHPSHWIWASVALFSVSMALILKAPRSPSNSENEAPGDGVGPGT